MMRHHRPRRGGPKGRGMCQAVAGEGVSREGDSDESSWTKGRRSRPGGQSVTGTKERGSKGGGCVPVCDWYQGEGGPKREGQAIVDHTKTGMSSMDQQWQC